MNFDLRIPIGGMFAIFGLILIGTGLLGGEELTRQSLGINMNLWCGVGQFVFGALMLVLSFRRARRAPETPGEDSASSRER